MDRNKSIVRVAKTLRHQSARILSRLAVASLGLAANVQAADLTVIVEGIRTDRGNVRAGIYNQAAGFPASPLLVQVQPAKPWHASFVFKNLKPGDYAISAIHDLNANDRLDRNFFGKPNEPYGFSNNARAMFGPPEYEEARFSLGEAGGSITLSVK